MCDLQTDGPLWVLVALITIAAIFVIPLIRRMVVVQSEARHVNVMDGDDFCHDCRGIRVFYFDKAALQHSSLSNSAVTFHFASDHSYDHTDLWNSQVAKIAQKHNQMCVEAGVVVNCWKVGGNHPSEIDVLFEVRWDCGTKKVYSHAGGELEKIRILDMGPTGYRAPIILCDICLTPVTGFSFRCIHDACSNGLEEVYDLCYRHYNSDCHLDGGFQTHQFQCVMQTSFTFERERNVIPLRLGSTKYTLVGLFAGALVTGNPNASAKGRICRVVHKGGEHEFGMADMWNCTAEIEYEGNKELCYEDIVTRNKVDACIFALEPGDGGPVYSDHFPTIALDNFMFLKEITKFHHNVECKQLQCGSYCYISKNPSLLTISNTSLTEINHRETFWDSCHELQVVNLLHNRLTSIPDQLLNHKESLQIIALSFNNFDYFPATLFECRKLENLNLIHNQLAIVPRDICLFSNLKDLFLDNNSIRMLPDAIGELVNLRVLGLSFNLLTSLPPSFSKLHSLHRLELHHNYFKFFPFVLYSPELCSPEPHLRTLTLNNNRIQVIPDEAKCLINYLTHFTIHDNPIQIDEALCSSHYKLVELIKTQSNASKHKGILRVLILGKCGSGKSSLVKTLVDRDKYITPVDKEVVDHTVGINQYSYAFRKMDKVYAINLWDFAGEKCYAMMNQMFLSPGNLIWLVFDMSEYVIDDKKYFEDNIGTWLRAVIAKIGTPVVWIIGTHADRRPNDAQAIKANVEKLTLEVLNSFNRQYGEHSDSNSWVITECEYRCNTLPNIEFIKCSMQIFIISNAHDLDGHCDLHKKIKELPTQHNLSAFFEELKPHWSSSEEYLLKKMSNLYPPIINKNDAFDLLKQMRLVKDEPEFESFIGNLHVRGEVYVFGQTIYLDTVWLISLLREIFRHDVCERLTQIMRKSSKNQIVVNVALHGLTSTGTIDVDHLLELWKPLGVSRNCGLDETVQLLFSFKLAFRIRSTKGYTCMFPWLLAEIDKDKITFANIFQNLPLCGRYILLVYAFDFIPPTFFERLLTCCSERTDVFKITRYKMLAHYCNQLISVLLMPEDGRPYTGCITFVVTDEKLSDTSSTDYGPIWSTIMHLTEGFSELIKDWHGICPEMLIACPLCVESKEHHPHMFPFVPLEGAQFYRHCDLHAHKVPAARLSSPKTILQDSFKSLGMVLKNEMLHKIASKCPGIQAQWKQLAKYLNFTDDEITILQSNNKMETMYEQCFQMLLEWRQRDGCNATMNKLEEALKMVGLSLYTTTQRK